MKTDWHRSHRACPHFQPNLDHKAADDTKRQQNWRVGHATSIHSLLNRQSGTHQGCTFPLVSSKITCLMAFVTSRQDHVYIWQFMMPSYFYQKQLDIAIEFCIAFQFSSNVHFTTNDLQNTSMNLFYGWSSVWASQGTMPFLATA